MTLDMFKHFDELAILVTGVGMDTAPEVIDRRSGARTTCRPTRTEGIAGLATRWSWDSDRVRHPGPRDNAWAGTLPIDRGALEAQLTLVVGDEVRHATVRWPGPEPTRMPPPAATPKRERRARKVRA